MEEIYSNILYVIISCVVTYSLIVPTSHIFGLENSNPVNGSIDPSETSQSVATTEQTPKDVSQNVETAKSEPQKANDPISEQESSKQSEQTIKLLPVPTGHPTSSSQNKQLKFLPGPTGHLQEELGL